ncbi:MAG: hypothetical protein WAL97_05175 [Halobacteriota archaeon]
MNRDNDEIEVNVDDLLDVINEQRQRNAEQKKVDFCMMVQKTIDGFNVEVNLHDLLDLGVKPSEIFNVIRQR